MVETERVGLTKKMVQNRGYTYSEKYLSKNKCNNSAMNEYFW